MCKLSLQSIRFFLAKNPPEKGDVFSAKQKYHMYSIRTLSWSNLISLGISFFLPRLFRSLGNEKVI